MKVRGEQKLSNARIPGQVLVEARRGSDRSHGLQVFIGKLLFAMKKKYPELANPVRELSSHMECPGEEHWKSIGRMVGYLSQTCRNSGESISAIVTTTVRNS